MPGYKGHLFFGALVGGGLSYVLGCYYLLSPFLVASMVVGALIGALFPDIDIKSRGQRLFFCSAFVIALYFAITAQKYALGMLAIMMVIPFVARHRGLTHQWWFVAGVSLLIAVAGVLYCPAIKLEMMLLALSFCFGALSHLILDAIV